MGSWPNMLRSLLVIGLIVAGFVAIVPRISEVERPAVDAASKASFVAKQTGWQVELPTGLGAQWVPTVATLSPGTEKVLTFTTVWSTPSGGDIALKEAADVTPGWIDRSVGGGVAAGEVTIDGRTWERYAVADRRQVSYLLRGSVEGAGDGSGAAAGKGVTMVATGTVPDAELEALLGALSPVEPAS
jgi:hypothetical protein